MTLNRCSKTFLQFALFALLHCLVPQDTHAMERSGNVNDIVIGAVLPLTGDVSSFGVGQKDGIDLAVKLANQASDGPQYRVVYQDSQSSSTGAVNALEQLLLQYDPVAIIGDSTSSATGAIIPIIDDRKKLLISPSASAPNLSGLSRYFFRVFPSDTEEGAFLAETISNAHPGAKVVVIYVNNDYGQGLRSVFVDEAQQQELKVAADLGFERTETNFRSIVARVQSLSPDVIYMPSYYEDGGLLIKQLRQAGIKAPLYGATTHEDPLLISIAGEAAEGFKYPVAAGFDANSTDETVQNFIAAYQQEFNKAPGLLDALGFDCANLIIDGIQKNGQSGEGIRSYLQDTPSIAGAAGRMTFDENGDVSKPIALKVVRDGQFVSFSNY